MRKLNSLLVAVLTVVFSPLFPLTANAQSMSHEEEFVRNSYAKLSFMCELVPVTQAAFRDHSHKDKTDVATLDTAIAQACPVFALSGFTVAPISDIANEPLGQFVTLPTPHDQILQASPMALSYNYNGNITSWTGAKFEWKDSHANGSLYPENFTVAKALQTGGLLWSDQPHATFTRYAAYTVNATFQGKSTGPHRALFLFETDASGKEISNPHDLITGEGLLYHVLDDPAYPGAFLSSDWRDVPVVAAWVRSHELSGAACSAAAAKTICCSGGRCGISQADLNRDLAAALPSPKNAGQQ